VLLLAGIAPAVLGLLTPFNVMMSAFVHANLNWTLGPFRYVLASPVFHRWHHTAAERGGSKNFAGTFPIWDLLFGTFYMPATELPDAYGIGEPDFPSTLGGQLLYPFRERREPQIEPAKKVA
jgi:sterol desaturase/sphingolipid hydroxylase (fatty acid hydroxylase superfamily)